MVGLSLSLPHLNGSQLHHQKGGAKAPNHWPLPLLPLKDTDRTASKCLQRYLSTRKRSGCWFNHSSQSAYELRINRVTEGGKLVVLQLQLVLQFIVNSNDKSISGALLYHILTCTHLL